MDKPEEGQQVDKVDKQPGTLTYAGLEKQIATGAVCCSTVKLKPAVPGCNIYPPTYAPSQDSKKGREHPYSTDERWIDGVKQNCVLLNSTPSEANASELAILGSMAQGMEKTEGTVSTIDKLSFISVDIRNKGVDEFLMRTIIPGKMTTLELPHRFSDGVIKSSQDKKNEAISRQLAMTCNLNATPAYMYDIASLVYGCFFPNKGGLGAKLKRIVQTEVIGVDYLLGTDVGGRHDPFVSQKQQIFVGPNGPTLDESTKVDQKDAGVDSVTIDIGSNKPPSIKTSGDDKAKHGGVSVRYALQNSYLSLRNVRELRFPINGKVSSAVDKAGRAVVAALALCGVALRRACGYSLRSHCDLVVDGDTRWLWTGVDESGSETKFVLKPADAIALFNEAVKKAEDLNLKFAERIVLDASGLLVEFLKKGIQELDIGVDGASLGGALTLDKQESKKQAKKGGE